MPTHRKIQARKRSRPPSSTGQTARSVTARKRAPRYPAAPAPRDARALTSAQKRHLRSFAHALRPVVQVGQKGLTPAVLAEFDLALEHHELVKIKLTDGDREARATAIQSLREHSGAEIVQTIGKVACFYRCNPDRAQFKLTR